MQTFAPPRGDATAARLELIRGRRVTVRAARIGELCRAAFSARLPKTSGADGQVRIEYPRFAFAGFRRPAHFADIELNAALPWAITLTGGIGDATIDLHALGMVGLDVTGGVSSVRMLLPPPQGGVRVRIESGASGLTLLRPPGVPATLRITGGASRLTFDDERYGAIGGRTELVSPGAGHTRDRYEIDILGGATDLTITEADPWPA